jgi:membrane fusion protein, multidrug efflux system
MNSSQESTGAMNGADTNRGNSSNHRVKHTAYGRRRAVALASVFVIGITAWAGVRGSRQRAQVAGANQKAPTATPAVAAVAHKGNIGVYFTGLGTVTPLYTVTVKSRVDGQILNVSYKEGQAVRKGAPLVEIDPRPYQAQLTQYDGQLAKDQAALQNAQVDLQRYETLITKNAIAKQIEATQQATVIQDQGAVKTDEGNIASAKLNIAYCHITSPIDGRVGLRLVDPGNMVYASAGTALVVITQTNPISVIFTLPEQQLAPVLKRVRAGERLSVAALDADSKTIVARGQLTTVDNQIDQSTGTLKLRAVFANTDGALFPNQFVNAQLLVDVKKDVTLVPNAAIQRNGSKTFVYLVKPDHAVTVREVNVDTANPDESEITSGVAPGDVLVTQGVDKLQEGNVVQAQVQQPVSTPINSVSATTSAKENENRAASAASQPSAGQ